MERAWWSFTINYSPIQQTCMCAVHSCICHTTAHIPCILYSFPHDLNSLIWVCRYVPVHVHTCIWTWSPRGRMFFSVQVWAHGDGKMYGARRMISTGFYTICNSPCWIQSGCPRYRSEIYNNFPYYQPKQHMSTSQRNSSLSDMC